MLFIPVEEMREKPKTVYHKKSRECNSVEGASHGEESEKGAIIYSGMLLKPLVLVLLSFSLTPSSAMIYLFVNNFLHQHHAP